MAPTDLTRTGALAGLVAGGISATAYAFHCMDDSLPFVLSGTADHRPVHLGRCDARTATSALVTDLTRFRRWRLARLLGEEPG